MKIATREFTSEPTSWLIPTPKLKTIRPPRNESPDVFGGNGSKRK